MTRLMVRTALWLLLSCSLAAAPAWAGGETVRLDDGRRLTLMHPGVDGVSAPRSVDEAALPPAYPRAALAIGGDSSVTLAVLVLGDGTVAATEVVHADHPGRGFEWAAENAVRQWRFDPARKGRRPVHSYAFVRLTFREPGTGLGALFTSRGWDAALSSTVGNATMTTRGAAGTSSVVRAGTAGSESLAPRPRNTWPVRATMPETVGGQMYRKPATAK